MLNVNVKLNGMDSKSLTEGIAVEDVYTLYMDSWSLTSVVINNKSYFVDSVLSSGNNITINLM